MANSWPYVSVAVQIIPSYEIHKGLTGHSEYNGKARECWLFVRTVTEQLLSKVFFKKQKTNKMSVICSCPW